MRGLLTLLMYAGFFYLMMRYGCGAHMIHGHGNHGHEGHGDSGVNDGSTKDPVCGMSVEQGQGYTKNQEGRVLHFCSRKCLDSFESDPKRYLA